MRTAIILLVAMAVAAPVSAQTISIVDSTRALRTHAEGVVWNGSNFVTGTDTDSSDNIVAGPYNTSITSLVPQGLSEGQGDAAQNTSVLTTTVYGTGLAKARGFSAGSSAGATAEGRSTISVTFNIGAPSSFNLIGDLHIVRDTANSQNNFYHPSAYIRVTTLGGTVIQGIAMSETTQNLTINQSFLLGAGSYKIEAEAYAWAFVSQSGGQATTNFNFQLTPIPAPGAMGLLSMTALASLRRRRA